MPDAPPEASIYLFKDVPMTPDYSVTVDVGGATLFSHLQANGSVVWFENNFNYYRLPDMIRVEANYEQLRKCTYGCLLLQRGPNAAGESDHIRYLYFWVDGVRLVKQNAVTTVLGQKDIVELTVREDVWANNNGNYLVVDSFVERRHMPRWDSSTPPAPIYYPDAEQGVTGAYQLEDSQDISAPVKVVWHPSGPDRHEEEVDPRYIVAFVLDQNGQGHIYIGMDIEPDELNPVWDSTKSFSLFTVEDILDGSFFSAAGITAEFVQSITVTSFVGDLTDCLALGKDSNSDWFVYMNSSASAFSSVYTLHNNGALGWIEVDPEFLKLYLMMKKKSFTMQVVKPDKAHIEGDGTGYDEYHEPMMFRAPARIRKAVTAFGGELFTIPDIAAFRSVFGLQNIFDLNGTVTYVFAGTDLMEANAIGSLGVIEAASLPIYNSAWKSYEAINKAGDDIAYSAHQVAAVGGGIANTTLAAAGGFLMGGGPAGAILGAAGGITGTVTSVYANKEELKAKRTTLKNSPCNVKAGGSGLGAYVRKLTDPYYITLVMDDQAMERLRTMYYWFGYSVNRTFKGALTLKTRKRFDFIKTNGNRVKGTVTAEAAQIISGIFDRGVTIYHISSLTDFQQVGDGTMYDNDEV